MDWSTVLSWASVVAGGAVTVGSVALPILAKAFPEITWIQTAYNVGSRLVTSVKAYKILKKDGDK